mgnify:CR=1 FL=1
MSLSIQNNSRRQAYSSLAAVRLISGITAYEGEVINLSGHTTEGDGGGGDFYWDASSTATDNNGTIVKLADTTTGRFIRVDQTRISVRMFGAVGNGSTDDTTKINVALDSGRDILFPIGTYLITDALTPGNSQKIYGQDRTTSIIKVDAATFNMSALGVIISPASEPGCSISDIGIEFVQPSGSGEVRANMNQYPPAVYAVSSPRTVIDNLRVSRGWDGIKLTGNSGGSYLGRLELGCYNLNVEIDNSLDFMHGESWHIWPFGGDTGDLLAVWKDGSTVALTLGDVDGFNLDKLACFSSRVDINGISSILPFIFGSIQLDGTNSELNITEGGVIIGNLYSSKSTTETVSSIKVTGGRVDISNAHIEGGEAGYQIQVTGGRLSTSVSAGQLSLSNMTFRWPNTARTEPMIEQSGSGILIVAECQPDHYTAGTEVIHATTDVLGTNINGFPLSPHTLTLPTFSAITNHGTSGRYRSLDVWNASLTCTTVGDLSVVYGSRTGFINLDGDFYDFHLRLVCTPTFTTASGTLSITGFNITPTTASDFAIGSYSKIGLNTNFTSLSIANTSSGMTVQTQGDNQALTNAVIASLASGVEITILVTGRGKI